MAISWHSGRRGFLGFLKANLLDADGNPKPGVIPAFVPVDGTGAEAPAGTSAAPFYTAGSRPATPVTGTIPNTAVAYTANQSIGGIVAIPTGLAAGTLIVTGTVRLYTATANHSVQGAINYLFWAATPSGSTYTDAQAAVIVAGDIPKLRGGAVGTWAAFGTNQANVATLTIPPMIVDAGGLIYLTVTASAGNTFSAANTISFVFNANS